MSKPAFFTLTLDVYIVMAFQHIVTIFQQANVNNVQFIWCVATSSSGTNVGATVTSYFPGDKYVSWVAMDGYNRSVQQPKSFQDIFSGTYSALASLSKRPIMVPEVGTVDYPGKPQWLLTSFLTTIPNNFPKIKAVNYFDSQGSTYNYRIDSSPESLSAIKQIYANSHYQASAPVATLTY